MCLSFIKTVVILKVEKVGLSWWLSGEGSACIARDMDSIPDLGRSYMPQSS